MSWQATNQSDTAKYKITRDPAFEGSSYREVTASTNPSFVDTGLIIYKKYTYTIIAWDKAENEGKVATNFVKFGEVEEEVTATKDSVINFMDMTLKIPAGAVTTNTKIQIKWITNVWKVNHVKMMGKVFDFKPDGLKFNKASELTVKYDDTKIPKGFEEKHVFAFTWSNGKKPVNMYRVSIDTNKNEVVSKMFHFSGLGAGVMDLPSNPQAGGGVKTDLTKLAKANPLAGMNLIGAPSANNTGDLVSSYPIPLPKGTGGLTPQVSLVYSSSSPSGNCGVGWNLSAGSAIVRVNKLKRGVPKYDSSDKFMFNGQELVHIGGNKYRLKVSGGSVIEFQRIFKTFSSGGQPFTYEYWEMKDTRGNVTIFGDNNLYVGTIPGVPSNVLLGRNATICKTYHDRFVGYSWNIKEMKDIYGNKVAYYYQNTENILNVKTITYAGGKRKVAFEWGDKIDKRVSYSSGLRQKSRRKLENIKILYNNSETSKYVMNYTTSGTVPKDYLTKIDYGVFNGNTTSIMNSSHFKYEDEIMGFDEDNPKGWALPEYIAGHNSAASVTYVHDNSQTYVDTFDINGDGLADYVHKVPNENHMNVYLNYGTNFSYIVNQNPIIIPCPNFSIGASINYVYNKDDRSYNEITTMDINGDGFVDRVMKHRSEEKMYIRYGNGTDFNSYDEWTCQNFTGDFGQQIYSFSSDISYTYTRSGYGSKTFVSTMDMNGDGLADRVFMIGSDIAYIMFNNGHGFDDTVRWTSMKFDPIPNTISYTWKPSDKHSHTQIQTIDMNGDGLPDRVARYGDYQGFRIRFNTGSGFSATEYWNCGGILSENYLAYTYTEDDYSYGFSSFMDMNGDGLLDYVFKQGDNHKTPFTIYFNTGTGFTGPVPWTVPNFYIAWRDRDRGPNFYNSLSYTLINGKHSHQFIGMKDMNGDGLPDRVKREHRGIRFNFYVNKTRKNRLLNKVINGIGGEYSIIYKKTKNSVDMPFQKRVVEKIESKDTITGFQKALHYSFSGGKYDRTEKQFMGFNKMKVTDAGGNITESRFHTHDFRLAGRSYYSISRNKHNNILKKSTQHWKIENLYNNKVFTAVSDVETQYKYTGLSSLDLPILTTTKTVTFDNKGLNGIYPTVETSVLGSKTSTKTIGYQQITINGVTSYLPNDVETKVNGITTSHKKIKFYETGNKIGKVEKKEEKVLTKSDTWLTNTYDYDDYGNISKKTDPRGNFVEYTYDPVFHIYSITEKTTSVLGEIYTSTSQYDYATGNLKQSDDDFGNTITYHYDTVNRLDAVHWNGNLITEIAYGVNGYRISSRTKTYFEPGKSVEKYVYKDGFGKTVQEKEQAVIGGDIRYISTPRFEIDSLGRVIKSGETFVSDNANFNPLYSMPWGGVTTTIFDDLGRVVLTRIYSSTKVLISETSTEYIVNATGSTVTATDPKGRKKRVYKDIYGNVKNVIDDYLGKNITTTYNYDVLGRLKSTVESGGQTTSITYDEMGQKLTVTTPDTGISKYVYNDYGDMTRQENNNEQVTRFYYDASGRLDRVLYHDNKETKFIYGTTNYQKGQLEEERGIGYTNVLTYNQLGNVIKDTKIIDGISYVMEQSYTLAGQIKSMKYPDGKEVHYSYNASGDLDKMGDTVGGDKFLKHIYRNKDGFRTNVQYGNGTSTSYSYDPLKKTIKTIETKKDSSGEKIQSLTYDIDKMGNVNSIVDGVNGGTTSYTYDNLNRLSTSTANGYSITSMNYTRTVTFSDNGNLLTKSDVGNYSYQNGTHRVTQAGPYSFTYDSNGNMVTKKSNTVLTRFKYNARDNLSMVTNDYIGDGGGKWARFTYDSGGQRIKKWSSAGNSSLYVNGYYTIKNGKYTNRHIYAGSERICTIVNDEPSYIHRDHINSGGVISTNGGNVGDKIAFSPYGQVVYQMNTNSLLEEKFTGQILDEETGLYYYNSRYYDPKIGVFISPDSLIPDPFDSQMLNRYMYVRGNPVMYVDPDGHSAILIGMVIGAVVGTVAGGTHGFTDFSQFDWNAAWKGGVTGGSISIAAAPAGTVSSFTSSVVNSAMWGSYFGAATGGISAYRAGGDVFSGMLLGSVVGGLSGAATGALGNWLTPQTKNLLGYIGSGMVKGTVSGAGMGLISGYGGGQGDFQSMLEGLSKGAMFGALFGGAVGAGEYYLKYGGWKEMNLKLGNIKDKLGKSIDNPSLTIYNREKYGITLNSKIVKGANHLSIKIPSSFNVNTKALIKSAIGTAFFHTSIAAAGFSFNDKIIEALKKRIEDGVEGKIRY